MKKLTRWSDYRKKKFTPELRKQLDEDLKKNIFDRDLRALRQVTGKTQVQMARMAGMTQSELSKLERRDDMLLSTLKRYVHALGGELEVVAVFDDKRVRLRALG